MHYELEKPEVAVINDVSFSVYSWGDAESFVIVPVRCAIAMVWRSQGPVLNIGYG